MALNPDGSEQRKDQHGKLGTHGDGLVGRERCLYGGVRRGGEGLRSESTAGKCKKWTLFPLLVMHGVGKYVAEESGEGAGRTKVSSYRRWPSKSTRSVSSKQMLRMGLKMSAPHNIDDARLV
jgi:hypothetical protein